MEASWQTAEAVARKYGKPLMNSETGCTGRGNPYELALGKCYEHHAGFYAFELMIHGHFGPIHGFFYPDGTIRDPGIITAFLGISRNRNLPTMIKENANMEHYVEKALAEARDALALDLARPGTTDALLEAAEYCANLLEGNAPTCWKGTSWSPCGTSRPPTSRPGAPRRSPSGTAGPSGTSCLT